MRSSAEFVAGMKIAKYTIVKQMQDNPNLLPDDHKKQVEAGYQEKSRCHVNFGNKMFHKVTIMMHSNSKTNPVIGDHHQCYQIPKF